MLYNSYKWFFLLIGVPSTVSRFCFSNPKGSMS